MPDAQLQRRRPRWLALWATGILAALSAAPIASGQAAPAAAETGRAEQEKEACSQNLQRIYEAIQKFQAQRRDLPNWLSDLVPNYLDDANVLICPVCRRTGQTEKAPLADPKLPCSYLFEFCPVPLGNQATNAPNRTRREWKRRQMGLVGSQVPIVRCRHHRPVLNLAFDGRIFESPAAWEALFTNQVNAAELTAARLFAAEPQPAPKLRKKAAAKGPGESETNASK